MSFPLHRSLDSLGALAPDIDGKLRTRFQKRVDEFKALIEGDDSILKAREDELALLASGETLVAENNAFRTTSRQLSTGSWSPPIMTSAKPSEKPRQRSATERAFCSARPS